MSPLKRFPSEGPPARHFPNLVREGEDQLADAVDPRDHDLVSVELDCDVDLAPVAFVEVLSAAQPLDQLRGRCGIDDLVGRYLRELAAKLLAHFAQAHGVYLREAGVAQVSDDLEIQNEQPHFRFALVAALRGLGAIRSEEQHARQRECERRCAQQGPGAKRKCMSHCKKASLIA